MASRKCNSSISITTVSPKESESFIYVLADVFDTDINIKGLNQINKMARGEITINLEKGCVLKSNLAQALVPRTFNEPDLAESLVGLYRPENRSIVSADEMRVICHITPEVVDDMLGLPLSGVPIVESNHSDKVNSRSP